MSSKIPSIAQCSVDSFSPLNARFKGFRLVITSVPFFYFGVEQCQDHVKFFWQHCFYADIFKMADWHQLQNTSSTV